MIVRAPYARRFRDAILVNLFLVIGELPLASFRLRLRTAREAGSYSLLLNFRRKFGKPRVFLKQIAIGHAGDIIANGPVQTFAFNALGRRLTE